MAQWKVVFFYTWAGSLYFCICWLAGRKVDASIYSLFCVLVDSQRLTHTTHKLTLEFTSHWWQNGIGWWDKNTCQGCLEWLREDNIGEEYFEDIFEAVHIS